MNVTHADRPDALRDADRDNLPVVILPTPPLQEGCSVCPTRSACTARNLDEHLLHQLTGCIDTSPVLQRKDYLYRLGDDGERCYVVRSGVFKTMTLTASGEEYVTGFHYPGELLGLSGQATGEYMDSAQALTSSTACGIRSDNFPELFAIGAGQSLVRLMAERQLNDQCLENNLRQSKAESRIAGYLVLLMKRLERLGFDGAILPAPMSRTDLANHLGLTLECLSRVFGKWKRAGFIATEKDRIRICNAGALDALARHLL
jgi:CRP/FNR family transcriptional regulator